MEENRYLSVKFDNANKGYTFYTTDFSIKKDDYVVVETQKGVELGLVNVEPFKESNVSMEVLPIIRKATNRDIENHENNKIDAGKALDFCQKESDLLGLGMKVMSSEYTLDKSKVTLIYTADDRVDFRELLKILASELHCRIELRQIGTRDKAKVVGGIGVCGRKLCCANHIKEFEKVTINMAKNQNLSLNTSKLSGQCGSLLCCLKYEEEAYNELRSGLPKVGSEVTYENEKYKVISYNLISGFVKLNKKDAYVNLTLKEFRDICLKHE